MEILKEKDITSSLCDADCDGLFLEVNKNIFIDRYDFEMDGVFKNLGAWKKFCKKVDNEGIEFLLRRKYINKKNLLSQKFAVKIGDNKYIEVSSKDIKMFFTYEWYWMKKQTFAEAGILEIYAEISIN